MDPELEKLLSQAAHAPATGASSSTAPVPNVYLGSHHDEVDTPFDNKQVANDGVASDRIVNHPATDRIADIDSASASIYGWSDSRLKKWEKLLLDNGLIEPGQYNYEDLVAKWSAAVEGAANLFGAGKKVTPEQYVEVYVGSHGIGGTGKSGPTTTTRKDYQEIDDLDARAAAEDTYRALMGEGRVSAKETAAVKAALQAYADNHPSITTQTTKANGNVVTHTSGGMSSAAAGQIVEDIVKSKPNYAETQAATTVHSWLLDALGPAVSGY